ncbi:GNAT family N-acetyltransferase [Aureimonas ureilytica]|uniref:GNAT family N-acetyltransferase n=1 Tax=Aureimonas ureilytica TaxID=401562 RepID=UPI00073459B1|nr:GNAT family N-acetyltransferase [Aureimonas ureilytica]
MCDPGRPVSDVRLGGDALLALAPDLAAMSLLTDATHPVLRDRDVLSYRAGWMGVTTPSRAGEVPGNVSGRPQRPPMPTGPLYVRYIPWLGRTLSFVAATMKDLPRLHGWLNDPWVDRFWRDAGSLEQHRAYLQRQLDDPHTIPIIGQLDGVPFGYFATVDLPMKRAALVVLSRERFETSRLWLPAQGAMPPS